MIVATSALVSARIAELLGDAPRSVEYWVRRFCGKENGPVALGASTRSNCRKSTTSFVGCRKVRLGGNLWDGETLAAWIAKRYGLEWGVRQCQRLFRQLGFRLRKPRPAVAEADAKNSRR